MDKQPVGQLPDLTQSNNDDEIMVITNSEYNQLKKEKISDLITDFTSTNENNALTKGTDGKMFVTDFGNASNITEGILPTSVLPEIPLEKIPDIPKDKLPPIETSDLPVSGVTADTYAYPSSVTVNAQGQVTAIEEGSPSGANANTDLSNLTPTGEAHFASPSLNNLSEAGQAILNNKLNKTQISNCILAAPNGVLTYTGNTATLKQGLKVLIPNGLNSDGTLNNLEEELPADITYSFTYLSNNQTITFAKTAAGGEGFNISNKYIVSEVEPASEPFLLWYNPKTNIMKRANESGVFTTTHGAVIATNVVTDSSGNITSINIRNVFKAVDYNAAGIVVSKSGNNSSGYRLWSDGWCEQWGQSSTTSGGEQIFITLPFAYVDSNYIINLTQKRNAAGANAYPLVYSQDSTGFSFFGDSKAVNYWYTCGYIY